MEESRWSRQEFLALLAGAGAATAAAGLAAPSAAAQDSPRKGYVVALTHAPQDAHRIMLGLVLASKLPEGDNHLWFAIDGGQVCLREQAARITSPLFKPFGTAADVLAEVKKRGVKVHI